MKIFSVKVILKSYIFDSSGFAIIIVDPAEKTNTGRINIEAAREKL